MNKTWFCPGELQILWGMQTDSQITIWPDPMGSGWRSPIESFGYPDGEETILTGRGKPRQVWGGGGV